MEVNSNGRLTIYIRILMVTASAILLAAIFTRMAPEMSAIAQTCSNPDWYAVNLPKLSEDGSINMRLGGMAGKSPQSNK